MILKETYKDGITITQYTGLKSLTSIKDRYLIGFRYSPDTSDKDALKHFKKYHNLNN